MPSYQLYVRLNCPTSIKCLRAQFLGAELDLHRAEHLCRRCTPGSACSDFVHPSVPCPFPKGLSPTKHQCTFEGFPSCGYFMCVFNCLHFQKETKKAMDILQWERTYAVTLENMQHVINKSCRTGLLQGQSQSANFLMLFTKSNRHSAAHLFLQPLTSR